jgi:hypothetical protein
MAIPTRGLNQIRTLSGRADKLSIPYRSYMQITCLEMERARRNMEHKSASERIAFIDARIREIEKTKQELLDGLVASGNDAQARLPGSTPNPAHRRNTGGFKIRY